MLSLLNSNNIILIALQSPKKCITVLLKYTTSFNWAIDENPPSHYLHDVI